MDVLEWQTFVSQASGVPPRGNPYGTVAFIGEAPGEKEALFGKPFIGESGKLLERMLENAGIDKSFIWFDNVCPFQPPKNNIGEVPKEMLAEYGKQLQEQLGALPNLNLVVPLGNTALFALTGKGGISKWRGSLITAKVIIWGEYRDVKCLPTYHPAYLLRSAGDTGQAISDFKKIRAEMDSPSPVNLPPKRTFLIQPTAKDVEDFLVEASQASMVSLDIETNMRTREIMCVGIAPSPTLAMCIPWERKKDREKLKVFLDSPQPKIGHNAALFDNFWLSWFGMPVRNLYIDTMYLHHCIDPSEQHSLAVLASLFTNEPYWKDEAIDAKEGTSIKFFAPSEAGWLYNCKDTSVTFEIAELLIKKVKEANKWDFYLKHYAELFPSLLSMMLGGIRIDLAETQKKYDSLVEDLKRIEKELEGFAGESLVPKKALSRKLEAKFLYGTLGLPKKWTNGRNTTGTKSLSTSADTIRTLMEKFPKKLAQIGPLLLEHARKQKLSTFFSLSRMQEEEDLREENKSEGEKSYRFYFTLKPSTGTGRLASSKSPFKTGANAQNLDREARTIYLPEPGHLMLELDGSQVESRMCYMYTGDKELIRLANTKPWEFDAHKENAVRIFNKPLETITKQERYTAKISVHSAQRNGSGKTLQRTFLNDQGVFKSVKECQGYIDSYFRAFPAVKNYFREIQSQLFRERKLTNLWGREITFPWDRFSDDMFREAYSFPMQSDCADWMNTRGVIPLHNWIKGNNKKSRLLLTVHDSLLISVFPPEAYELLQFIVPSLEAPLYYSGGPLVIPVEISLGKNWGEKVYEWKKPPGREELETAMNKLLEIKND